MTVISKDKAPTLDEMQCAPFHIFQSGPMSEGHALRYTRGDDCEGSYSYIMTVISMGKAPKLDGTQCAALFTIREAGE
jgi:hypothetical protein